MVTLILIFVGLALGSFINALVWRLHAKKDWVRGRSICVHCKHRLAAKDLVPVLSWLSLRGKCRYCGKPIDDSPLTELITPLLFILSYQFWPSNISGEGLVLFILWLGFLVGLIALALYDIKWLILPDKITYSLYVLAAVQTVVLLAYDPSFRRFLSIGWGFLIGGGIFYVLYQLSKGKWIGGGDVKLGGLLGLMLASGSLAMLTIFIASLAGSAFSLPMLATGKLKRTSKVPFGPFLILGAIIARIFGASIVSWYKNKLLFY